MIRPRLSKLTACLFALAAVAIEAEAKPIERRMSLDDLFRLADSVSVTIKKAESNVKVAEAAVEVAKNSLLPDINFSASATYNGNAWMADRYFSNGKNLDSRYGELQKQSMMVGLKEIFGIAAAVGILTIIGLSFSDLRGKYKAIIPKLPNLWRMVKYNKRH